MGSTPTSTSSCAPSAQTFCGSSTSSPSANVPRPAELNRKKLTYEDAIAIRSLPHVAAVDPELTYQNFQTGLGNVSLKHGTHKIQNTILNGTTSRMKDITDIELLEGRMWTDAEEERSANVVVLGHDAAADLFPNESPIGKDIECDGDVFTVIGVLDVQPQPFGSGRNTAGQLRVLSSGNLSQNPP